jgi:hypothetical protein
MSTMSPLNDAPKPRIPDAIDKQRLQAMQLVAKYMDLYPCQAQVLANETLR